MFRVTMKNVFNIDNEIRDFEETNRFKDYNEVLIYLLSTATKEMIGSGTVITIIIS